VLEELRVEYDAPFPLSYILGPKSQSVYGNIFILLLQIRRVKFLLDRILVSGSLAAAEVEDLKVVYAMRSKLAWFVR
jgi:gamma-tubulin complex component 5